MLDIQDPQVPPALSYPFGLVENAYRRLTNLVQDMPQAELDDPGPAENVNSTATLIAHLAYVDLGYLHAIKGIPVPPELEVEYGPYQTADGTLPAVTGKPAAELLARYRRVIDMARDHLKTLTDADALRPVTIAWWPKPATVRYVLWHMAGHSMFHQGQIARLRAGYRKRLAQG